MVTNVYRPLQSSFAFDND